MTPNAAALFAFVILILPMGYLLLAAPGFLFVKLDILPVARLMRMMFSAYFQVLVIAAVIGTVVFALTERWAFVIGVGVLASTLMVRRWLLSRLDSQIDNWPADVGRRLRRLHYSGMACNAVQLAIVIGSIPYIMGSPA
ncbi:hypothetical protein ASE66_11695 [Bosea sp. Root483D1]|uniref:hypothetical protein n=1 Tax=Bosea sp. Root483D1 TaxID=1736544 RepID=UPI00070C2B11|nr:hypothetical protein [Bosea sp. Root483D1]KRE16389.1 hypothetical protein ASE66_11695 [Bosea sp. Root483D1]